MRTGRSLIALFAGIALSLTTTRALAADKDAAGAPVVREKVTEGVFNVEGSFEVAALATTTWNVLSDYEHITQFVSSMRRSIIRERTDAGLVVEQHAVGKLLFFSKEMRVLLEITEDQPRSIQFTDVSRKDFDLYHGHWSIIEQPGRTQVLYRLTAKPKTSVPKFIGSSVFRATAASLLAEVQTEIARRAAQAPRTDIDGTARTDAAAEGK